MAHEPVEQEGLAHSSISHPVGGDDEVGARLREVRKARRRTLSDVSSAVGISESFLSQIERGSTNPSVATLRRIAVNLGVTIGDLFAQLSDGPQVVRAISRPALAFGVFATKYHLHPAPHRSFDMFICEFAPGGSTGAELYAHGDSEEIAYVLEGSVEFQVGEKVSALGPEDTIVYDSSTPHGVTAGNSSGAKVLFVACPPSF